MVHLVYAAFAGLLWVLGAALVVLLILLALPVRFAARVDSLHLDEETPFEWDRVSWEAQASGLLGALHVRFRRQGGEAGTEWRLFGIAKRPREDTGGRSEPNERDVGDDRDVPEEGARGSGSEDRAGQAQRGKRGVLRARVRRQASGGDGRGRSGGRRGAKKSKGGWPRKAINLLVLRRLLPDAQWLLRKVRRRMKLRVRGRLVYGFSDPFATGLVHGLTAAVPVFPELELHPDYLQGTLDGWVEFSLRMYPIEALLIAVQTCFRPGVRSLWWPKVRDVLRIDRIKSAKAIKWFRAKRIKEAHEP